MACKNCEYEELYDPETKEVTYMAEDPNYICDTCGNTLNCCCTCISNEQLKYNNEQLEAEVKELKDRVSKLELIIWSMKTYEEAEK